MGKGGEAILVGSSNHLRSKLLQLIQLWHSAFNLAVAKNHCNKYALSRMIVVVNHLTTACYQLVQNVLKVGFVLAQKVG